MRDGKILDLAFNMDNAPAAVKASAATHNYDYKRLQKAEDQIRLWTEEKNLATQDFKKSQAAFKRELDKWIPAAPKKETK